MAENHHDHYRRALTTLRKELTAEAEQQSEHAGTVVLDQSMIGRLSRMDALQGQQMALETQRRIQRKLQAVEGALRRLAAGDFGHCFVCGEEIPEERLRFDPTLTRCKACAQ